jgi:pimeloyl-ACP methyl ester carboxylesterase
MHSSSHGKGEAVLLIHGMPSNGRLWDEVVKEVSGQYRCIVIDLPGMGDTPFLPYGPSYFTEVAAQIEEVRRRHQVQRWHVVGHDGGSAIAVQYAYLYPKRVDCLALLSPAVFHDLKPFFLLDLLRRPVLGELSAPLVNAVFWHVAMRRALPGARHAMPRSSFAKNFRGIGGPWRLMRLVRWGKPEIVLEKFPSILKELACPTLVVYGSRDILPESFARRAAAQIANSQLIALDSGHFIPLEQAAQVSQHLVAFFRSRRVEDVAPLVSGAQQTPRQNDILSTRPEVALVPHPVARSMGPPAICE